MDRRAFLGRTAHLCSGTAARPVFGPLLGPFLGPFLGSVGCGDSFENLESFEGALLYSGARNAQGDGVFALDLSTGRYQFRITPRRVHGFASSPRWTVAFERRPGTQFWVMEEDRAVAVPENRQIRGHGCFSSDESLLYTSEADRDSSEGYVGVYETGTWTRTDEISIRGIGPHEILLLPGDTQDQILVANGGLHTRSGGPVLNLDTMASSLAVLNPHTQAATLLPMSVAKGSFRHLDQAGGLVVGGLQVQTEALHPPQSFPLAFRWQPETELQMLDETEALAVRMADYIGSVAAHPCLKTAALTSPRGSYAAFFDVAHARLVHGERMPDVSGVSALPHEEAAYILSNSSGELRTLRLKKEVKATSAFYPFAFDNHLHIRPSPSQRLTP